MSEPETRRSLWDGLHAAFHEPEQPIYRVVNATVWTLIALSVGLFLVELALGTDEAAEPVLRRVDQVILVAFVVELTLRIASFRPPALTFFRHSPASRARAHLVGRLRYAIEPLMLVDLLTVLALLPELRGLRALRLLRLLRSRAVFRYANPFQGLARAFEENRLLYMLAFSVLGVEVLLGGVSFYLIEAGRNPAMTGVADGLWWALVTLTTVGFGDISPVTLLGRAVGSVLMIGGMFTLALFAGIVGTTLLGSLLTLREEQFRMSRDIDHLVICGYNPGARMLLDALREELPEDAQLVIFAAGERGPDVPAEFTWVSGDPTKESELDKVRLTHASSLVIVGDRALPPQQADAVTILTVFTARRYLSAHATTARRTRPLYVVAEILEAENVDHALTAGADEVIETTRLGFSLVAHAVTMPGTAAIMSRVATVGAHSLYLGRVPDGVQAPLPFGELARQIKDAQGAMVIGVRDPASREDRLNPPDAHVVGADDQLIYLAKQHVLPD